MSIVLNNPSRDDLIPLIGEWIKIDISPGPLVGRLLLVSNAYIGLSIEAFASLAKATIKSQLYAIKDPIFAYGDENEMVYWWVYMSKTIEVIDEPNVNHESNVNHEPSGDQIQDAAWGEKNYIAPAKAPFEFL